VRRIPAPPSAVSINLELEDGEIWVDPEKIVRVLVNFIANSIDAMAGEGTLRIASMFQQGADNVCQIQISDTGAGMDEETLKKICQPFFTRKSKGTGLGLAICRKIIEAHKGRFTIKSKPQEGTTVVITLPVASSCQEC